MVNWDASKDQWLLSQIAPTTLSKSQLSELVQAWPSTFGAAPTECAISEHMVKVRKQSGTGTPGVSPSKSGKGKPTPDAGVKKSSTPRKGGNGVKKSKKPGYDSQSDEDNLSDNKSKVKSEEDVDEGADEPMTPTRARLPRAASTGVKLEETRKMYAMDASASDADD